MTKEPLDSERVQRPATHDADQVGAAQSSDLPARRQDQTSSQEDEAPKHRGSTDTELLLAALREEGRRKSEQYEANIRELVDYESNLRRAFQDFSQDETFVPGDLVQWKRFMRDREFPHVGAPAVVVKVLSDPIVTGPDARPAPEARDVVLGYLDGKNDFVTGFYSSNRLMKWE